MRSYALPLVLTCLYGCGRHSEQSGNLVASANLAAADMVSASEAALDDECEVLIDLMDAVVIPNSWAQDNREGVIILVGNSDEGAAVKAMERNGLSLRVSSELLKAFTDANESSRRWPDHVKASRSIQLASSESLAYAFQMGGWRRVKEDFPGACQVVSASRPGFSQDKRTAIIYFNFHRGPLSGGGMLVLLRRTTAGWTLEHEILSVIH